MKAKLARFFNEIWARMIQSRRTEPKFTMVVATYNVAPYINDFFESIQAQSGGIGDLEVIIVNDGSTDQSGNIAREWAERHPSNFHYVTQENQGVAAARNTGLSRAKGEWVCFPDPDDFLSPDYLAYMRTEIRRPRIRKLLAVTAPLIFYHEVTKEFTDDHPLNGRFKSKVMRYKSTDMRHILLAHTSSTFMRRADIIAHGLEFDTRIRPSFEDAHFIIRLLLLCPNRTISFLSQPKYYYRKRQAENSLVDNLVTNAEWYGPHLKYAYLSLLQEAKRLRGYVPTFVQANILFSLTSKLRYLIGPNFDSTILDIPSQKRFMNELQNVMDYITTPNIERLKLPGFFPIHRAGLIALFKNDSALKPKILLQGFCTESNTFEFRWVIGGSKPDDVILKVDNKIQKKHMRTSNQTLIFGQTFATIFRQKIKLCAGQSLTVSSNGQCIPIWGKQKALGFKPEYSALRDATK
ncbi:MAG: glycosyltransferase [Yoonia sp.]|uniref:glycosyltransferase family 2 protein n=1 Tax=Yoonia sp. TaxID=2212373 RepID=UPI0032676743